MAFDCWNWQLAELRQTQRQLEKDKVTKLHSFLLLLFKLSWCKRIYLCSGLVLLLFCITEYLVLLCCDALLQAALEVQKAELEERKKTLEEWEHKLLEKESSLAAYETKKTSKKLTDSASCEKSSPLYQPGAENFDVEAGLQTLNNRTKVSPILVHEGDDEIPTTHLCKVIADTVEETLPTSQVHSVIEKPREEGDGQIKIAMVKTEAMQSDTATDGEIQICCEGKTGLCLSLYMWLSFVNQWER